MAVKATDEVINTITKLARYGHTMYFIADAIGVSQNTLTNWKQKNPNVADALSIGQDGLLCDVKSRLAGIALHGKHRDSISASTFLLSRYETEAVSDVVTATDDDIKQSILDDLQA